MKLDPHLRPNKKINSKQIIELNIRSKTIKFLEENIIEKLHDIGFDNGFLKKKSKGETTKENIGKLDFIMGDHWSP